MYQLNILTDDRNMKGEKDPVGSVKGWYGRHVCSHAIPQELGLITVNPQITVL